MTHTAGERRPTPGAVTQLLAKVGAGNQAAFDEVFPLVYAELRRIAAREMRREKPGRTLQTTALVHEAYLRLLKDASLSFENRAHFLGIAARAMRRDPDRARARPRPRASGAAAPCGSPWTTSSRPCRRRRSTCSRSTRRFNDWPRLDERHARVVELRYFGGLSVEETAVALELSPATVKRAWTIARAWLYRELGGSGPAVDA